MINDQTVIMMYDMEAEIYRLVHFEDWTSGKVEGFPVCTASHFAHVVAKFFEIYTPSIGGNPIYQKIDWEAAKEGTVNEFETTKNTEV